MGKKYKLLVIKSISCGDVKYNMGDKVIILYLLCMMTVTGLLW